MEDFDTGVGHGHDARDLSMGLSGAAVEGKDAVVHLEYTPLHHDDTVHFLLDIELPDAMLTPILIELH